MRKLINVILGFVLGAVLTYYFCPREFQNTPQISKRVPYDTISVQEAKVLSQNWERNNPTEIDSTLDVEGSKKQMRSVSWSLEDISDYLVYAKAKSDTLGFTMTGVRVYLGNYGNVRNPVKKNRNTMFIVPTGHRSTSKASTLNLNILVAEEDILVPPLNEATGGDGGYPQ